MLRSRRDLARGQLAVALRDFDGAFEEGMRVIDTNLACDECGEIDVVALDRANQLALIDVDIAPDDGHLVRGLGHVDWAARNVPSLRRMYAGLRINYSLTPRLVLVAPQFSVALARAAGRIARPRIELVRYHAVDVFGGIGLAFERYDRQPVD